MVTAVQRIGSAIFNMLSPFTSTVPGLTPTDIAIVTRRDEPLKSLTDYYDLWWDYYRGKQRDPNLAEPTVTSDRDYEGAYNLVGVAIDVTVERLQVTGFDVSGPDLTDVQVAAVAEVAEAWWTFNRMRAEQQTVHARTMAQADGYVCLGWDALNDMPVFTFHNAQEVTPVYYNGVMTAAYKLWTEDVRDPNGNLQTRYRLTKYEPSRIMKFYQVNGRWLPWTGDVDSDGNPDGGVVDWTTPEGFPIGIPVVHFKNRPRGEDFGFSDVADLVTPQDSVNKQLASLDEAAGYQGAAQWWGLDLNSDALRKNPPTTGPGTLMVVQSASRDTKGSLGAFPAGEVDKLQASAMGAIKTLAAIARVPMHLLFPEGGTPPSGESLKTAEAGLVAKVEDRQTTFSNNWMDVFAVAIRMHNTFGRGPLLPPFAVVNVVWANPNTRSALSDEQVIALQATDLSWEGRMILRGWSPEEIAAERGRLEADGTGAPGAPALADVATEMARLAQVSKGEPPEPEDG